MSAPTLPRPLILCPTCDNPLPTLLAVCEKPDCLRAYIADDAAFARLVDE